MILGPIKEKDYGDLYVFSDNEDNMEDIEKRYKHLANDFKNFNKQKKKFNIGKSSSSLIEN